MIDSFGVMKVFTLDEANKTLTKVRPVVARIRLIHSKVAEYREFSLAASNSSQFGGGGMEGGSRYVKLLTEFGRQTSKLDSLGVQIKDFSRGLIDFPCERDGRIVLLCWQLGEGDEIEWWHDMEAGFAGRQPI